MDGSGLGQGMSTRAPGKRAVQCCRRVSSSPRACVAGMMPAGTVLLLGLGVLAPLQHWAQGGWGRGAGVPAWDAPRWVSGTPSRGVPGEGGSTVPGVWDRPEAKPLGQAAPRGGGRDGQIDSSGGWTDGWMEKQMCTRDGWMERLMDVLERRTHGETDRCTDGEQTPVPFPLALGMPGVLSYGAVPVLSPEARPMVGCWPGPRRDSGTAAGLLTSLAEQPVSTKPPAAPGQVALPDPAGSALRLASSVAAPWHAKPGSKQPQNARQVVSRDGGEASFRPLGGFASWQPLRARPLSLCPRWGRGFRLPALPAGHSRRGPALLPPALRPGSCTGAKAANSQLFSCNLKIRGLGNI